MPSGPPRMTWRWMKLNQKWDWIIAEIQTCGSITCTRSIRQVAGENKQMMRMNLGRVLSQVCTIFPPIGVADFQTVTPHPAMLISKTARDAPKNAPKNLSKEKVSAKPRKQNPSAGKTSEKRKAPHVAEKYVAHCSSCASIQMTNHAQQAQETYPVWDQTSKQTYRPGRDYFAARRLYRRRGSSHHRGGQSRDSECKKTRPKKYNGAHHYDHSTFPSLTHAPSRPWSRSLTMLTL